MPLLICLKALLFVVPVLLVAPLCLTAITLITAPINVFHAYKAALKTPRLGVSLKIVLAFVVWLPILLAPVIVLLLSPFYAIGLAVYCATIGTVDSSHNMWLGGFVFTAKLLGEHIKEFWSGCASEFKLRARDVEAPSADYTRYDFSIWWTPLCMVLSLLGSILVGIVGTLNFVVKVVPILLGLLFRYAKFYFVSIDDFGCLRFMLFIPWLISWFLLIPFVPVAGLCCVAGSFIYGLWLFTIPFRYKPLWKACLYWTANAVLNVDDLANDALRLGFSGNCCYDRDKTGPDMGQLQKKEFRQRITPAPAFVQQV